MTTKLRRSNRILGLLGVVLVVSLLNCCGTPTKQGMELAKLRDIAQRVEGGGVECPLAIPNALLRPDKVANNAPVLPFRSDGVSAQGVIGEGLPTKDSVRIWCTYAIGGLRVDLVVLGVPKGHALAGLLSTLKFVTDPVGALTFISANSDAPVGAARVIPAKNPAAFVRVAASSGDIGLMLWVTRTDAKAKLPSNDAVANQATRIARHFTN